MIEMRRPLLLLLALYSPALALSPPAARPPAKPYTVTNARQADFLAARQAHPAPALSPDKTGFQQKGTTLSLRLTNGRQVVFQSKPIATFEENGEEITYAGKLPQLHKYVLHASYYESAAYFLVDQTTGRVDTLRDMPIPNPGHTRLAATFQGYPYEGVPNGLDIYTIQNGRLRREFNIEQLKWLPYDLAWTSDNALILQCLPLAEADKITSPATQTRVLAAKAFYLRVSHR